jgi:hypothetical protein
MQHISSYWFGDTTNAYAIDSSAQNRNVDGPKLYQSVLIVRKLHRRIIAHKTKRLVE